MNQSNYLKLKKEMDRSQYPIKLKLKRFLTQLEDKSVENKEFRKLHHNQLKPQKPNLTNLNKVV